MTSLDRRFRALPEAEIRLLLLISAFSGTPEKPKELEGRVKLAKLDFLVRYPNYLARVLRFRRVEGIVVAELEQQGSPLHDRMIRYRYGPWDPSYYAVLGSLIGRGLVDALPISRGIGYRTTELGRSLVDSILRDGTWADIELRTTLVKRHLDKAGTTLKKLLYEAIPEMTSADWYDELR